MSRTTISAESVRATLVQCEVIQQYLNSLKSIVNMFISKHADVEKQYRDIKGLYEPKLTEVNLLTVDFLTSVRYKRLQNKLEKRKRLVEDFIVRL